MATADSDWAGAAQGRRWTVSVAEMVLRAFADSGLSRTAFAAQHGIHEQRLYQWERRLASASAVDAQPVAFRELEKTVAVDGQRPFELVLRSGMVLRIPETFEPAGLGRLLQVQNWLFVGHDLGGARTAATLTLVATCVTHDVNPRAYLHLATKLILAGWPQKNLRDLLPDRLAVSHPEVVLRLHDSAPRGAPPD